MKVAVLIVAILAISLVAWFRRSDTTWFVAPSEPEVLATPGVDCGGVTDLAALHEGGVREVAQREAKPTSSLTVEVRTREELREWCAAEQQQATESEVCSELEAVRGSMKQELVVAEAAIEQEFVVAQAELANAWAAEVQLEEEYFVEQQRAAEFAEALRAALWGEAAMEREFVATQAELANAQAAEMQLEEEHLLEREHVEELHGELQAAWQCERRSGELAAAIACDAASTKDELIESREQAEIVESRLLAAEQQLRDAHSELHGSCSVQLPAPKQQTWAAKEQLRAPVDHRSSGQRRMKQQLEVARN